MAAIKKTLIANRFVVAIGIVFFTAVLTYAIWFPRLGFFYDDWYMVWSGVTRGPNSLYPMFLVDRPFMGIIYAITYRFLGESPLGWHIYALLWRIAGAGAFYWILSIVWPKLRGWLVLAAVLFVVYPGFLALPNAATKVNHLTGFGVALFSIAFTLKAMQIRSKPWKWVLTALALCSTAFHLWIYEYMIGLEVMRISLMVWMHWQGRVSQLTAVRKVARTYLPYLLVVVIFLIWRFFFFDSSRMATDVEGMLGSYQADFVGLALRLIFQTLKDFFSVLVFAWGVRGYHLLSGASNTEIVAAILAALVTVLVVSGYLHIARRNPAIEHGPEPETPSPRTLIAFGALIALAAVLPVVLSLRYLNLMDPYKAYALHPSPGAIIFLLGIAMMFKPKFRTVLLVGLIAFSVATQTLNVQEWGRLWEVHRNFWWQVSWRVPDFKDDTLLVGYAPSGFAFQQDYEIWGPANLIYRPDTPRILIQSEVLDQHTALSILLRDSERGRMSRDIWMPRDYRNFLLASQPSVDACVRLIDGQMPVYSTDERLLVEKVGAYSNIDRILLDGASPTPPVTIFGKEPQHGWCYYYQKASLARQSGDWSRIVELYETAIAEGLVAADPTEYFVFIEGMVNTGRTDALERLLREGPFADIAVNYSFCQSLAVAPEYPENFGYRLDEMKELICSE